VGETPREPRRLLTVEDVARLLNVSAKTVQDWRYRGPGSASSQGRASCSVRRRRPGGVDQICGLEVATRFGPDGRFGSRTDRFRGSPS
jgi:Helix-turn-helix domain